ncbi:MAG: hypothetical protein JRN52_08280 [Nitrososphaerota archaeon]|nr:hypothetical protein [Nitrososphaerota archaeon]
MSERFLVDGMLGSLARKLRILGYDVAFDKKSDDQQLLKLAIESGRSLVTADINLYLQAKKLRINSILVGARTEKERLFQVLSSVGVSQIKISFVPRCSLCNGLLKDSGKSTKAGKEIYICTMCGKKYWQGSHWRNLESLFMEVNRLLLGNKDKNSRVGC